MNPPISGATIHAWMQYMSPEFRWYLIWSGDGIAPSPRDTNNGESQRTPKLCTDFSQRQATHWIDFRNVRLPNNSGPSGYAYACKLRIPSIRTWGVCLCFSRDAGEWRMKTICGLSTIGDGSKQTFPWNPHRGHPSRERWWILLSGCILLVWWGTKYTPWLE